MNIELAKRYDELKTERQPYIQRAETCAQMTIPSLFPPEGSNNENFHIPNQGLGSRAVKNLANKLLLSLLPPNTPFFQLSIDENEVAIGTEGQTNESLIRIEQHVTQSLEIELYRPVLGNAVKQLLVAGNYLIYCGGDTAKGYRLNKYVVQRDGYGQVSEILIKEVIKEQDIPESIREEVLQKKGNNHSDEDTYDQYTYVYREDEHYIVYQEISEIEIPNTRESYPLNACPFLALRMVPQDDEDYGRSYVEEHIGDLTSLERLSKCITDGSEAAARILYLITPNSTITPKQLEKAENGAILRGKAEDLSTHQLEKYADFRVAREEINEIKRDLSAAFLMNTSVTRNAERVTAEEIRFLAAELEQTLGGVYTSLAMEFQLPLVRFKLARLNREFTDYGDITSLKPKIITGVQSLGRLQDIEKIRALAELLTPFGPDVVSQYMHIDEFIARTAAALYLETEGLIVSPEERQQQLAEQQLAQLGQQVAPDMLKETLIPTKGT